MLFSNAIVSTTASIEPLSAFKAPKPPLLPENVQSPPVIVREAAAPTFTTPYSSPFTEVGVVVSGRFKPEIVPPPVKVVSEPVPEKANPEVPSAAPDNVSSFKLRVFVFPATVVTVLMPAIFPVTVISEPVPSASANPAAVDTSVAFAPDATNAAEMIAAINTPR